MAKHDEAYRMIIVESYRATRTGGLQGDVHVRPVAGQGLPTDLHVECSRSLRRNYPVGTKFRIKAKLTDREGGGEYLYSHHGWKYDVVA